MPLTLRRDLTRVLTTEEVDANFEGLADGTLVTGVSSSLVTFAQSGSGAIEETLQSRGRWTVFVTDFLSVADRASLIAGTDVDITTALTNAIARLPSTGGTLYLPQAEGDYLLSSTVTFLGLSGFCVIGSGFAGGAVGGTTLKWNGANGGTPILIDQCRDYSFENISIIPGTGTIAVGIDIDAIAPVTVTPTNGTFKHCHVNTGSTAGIRIGNTYKSNQDLHKFENVFLDGAGAAGYLIDSAQSKAHLITGGAITSKTTAGIQTGTGGSFRAYGVNFSANAIDIYLGTITDTIFVSGCHSESAGRFLDTAGPNSGAFCVILINNRCEMNAIHADGRYLRFQFGGPLTLLANDFANGNYTAAAVLYLNPAGAGAGVVSIGNTYPNNTFFSGYSTLATSISDNYYDSGTLNQPYPSVFTSATRFSFNSRCNLKQGAVLTAANNLTLGSDGNYFQVDGATQINLILNTDWQGGSVVTLKFNSTPTVKHNQAASGNNKPVLLAGAVDFVASASDTLTLRYDSTDAAWYEMSRAVI